MTGNGYQGQSWGIGGIPAQGIGPPLALPPRGAGVTDWKNVRSYGAIGNGITDDTAALYAAFASLQPGDTLYFPAGVYPFTGSNGPLTAAAQPAYIMGDGRDASVIAYSGTGVALWMYNPNGAGVTGWPTVPAWAGGIRGLTIDGTLAGASSVGLAIGDGQQFKLDELKIQNFAGAGSVGLHLVNTVWWTGRMWAKCQFNNNTTAVQFDVGLAANEGQNFGYSTWDFDIDAWAYQNGVVVNSGAMPYNSRLFIKGEWHTAATGGGACLTVTGTGAAGKSTITNCEIGIWAEIQGSDAGVPQTIVFGDTTNNKIKVCRGELFFLNASQWTPSNVTPATGGKSFGFTGAVLGDGNLFPASNGGNTPPLQLSGSCLVYAQGQLNPANGNLLIANGDFFETQLTGNLTIVWGSQSPQAGPQRKTIIIQQAASGGPFTVTWPHNAGPTPASPRVIWGGGAPTMSPGAGATDCYLLHSYDGATWVGQAIQAAT